MKILLVDDDPMNNFICKTAIKKCIQGAQITTYENPEEALEYILSHNSREYFENTLLLLDINMPEMTGWEFLASLEQDAATVLNQLRIYILSSSVDERDIQKARQTPYIKDFISKPLRREHIAEICHSE